MHIEEKQQQAHWRKIAKQVLKGEYCNLGLVSTNYNYFSKMESILKLEIIYISIIYYNIVIWVVNLFRMWRMIIMMIFNMSTSYFHKI
jgi:hypothetical protein